MNRRRLLARLSRGAVNNVNFSDLVDLVEGFGFSLLRVNGSHHIFGRPDIPGTVNLQRDNGDAKPYQIRQFLRLVKRHSLSLEDEE